MPGCRDRIMTQFPAEPSPGGVIWTVQFSESDHRQLSTAEVIRAFESRQLSPYSMICKEGLDWTQIGNVPHLVHAISTVVKRRNTTPPPPVAAKPVAAVAAEAPPRVPTPPVSAPLHLQLPPPPLDSQVAVPLVTRNVPAAHLVDGSDRDIATTPGVNRNTSTVTPFTVVAPPQEPEFEPASRWSAARLALLGAAAAALLFGVAFNSGLFKIAGSATPIGAVQPSLVQGTAAPAPTTAALPATPQPAVALAASSAVAPVILDFDSLPVEGTRPSARRTATPTAAVTLEAARKAMLEPAAEHAPAEGDAPPNSLDGPSKGAPPTAPTAVAAVDPNKPPGAFDNTAARSALAGASQRAQGCLGLGLVHTTGKVVVVFDPSGSVSAVNILTPEFAKPPLGPCLVAAFKQASVPPFVGAPTAVSKTFAQ